MPITNVVLFGPCRDLSAGRADTRIEIAFRHNQIYDQVRVTHRQCDRNRPTHAVSDDVGAPDVEIMKESRDAFSVILDCVSVFNRSLREAKPEEIDQKHSEPCKQRVPDGLHNSSDDAAPSPCRNTIVGSSPGRSW